MSLSKSSFYSQFRSKESLYRACLVHYCETTVDRLHQLREGSSSIRNFLDSILQNVIEDAASAKPRGCLILNSAVEFGQHREEFKEDVRRALGCIQQAFEQAILSGYRNGEICSSDSPKTLAVFVMTCVSGLRCMIKGGMSAEEASAVARKVVDSIF